ncbi:MAG: holo-ACP synthase [Clostridiales bacterium]|nr:holo-ACP synthase [Clostridiales bacterium]
MYSVGVDIVKISRIEEKIKSESFLREVYTDRELEHCRKAENYAGIFAAKEAYFKSLGTGIKRPVCQVEVLYADNGKPYIANDKNCDVSVSHDGEYAIAAVVRW